ncbi:aldo/keto reductase [Arenibaculum sp.]|uniref:aldo/keto reductase n=1 Tax=Arenibaculum sp. TaxID=2865862 RepID=UPI002E10804B|nr:aldo/keto reductase [Arenibaculum sp.]
MRKRKLGRTGLEVTEICLGTMTWGRQNTEAEGHAQMDWAIDRGITFWDTAEMYAIPPTAETYGRTEAIIGSWFASRGGRERVVLATKAIGRASGGYGWIRGGGARLDRDNLVRAVEDSLRRLRTDYIDLYQLHWPDRPTTRFGRRSVPLPEEDGDATPIDETLRALDDLVRAGKIRHVGLSNETAWGAMTFLRVSETLGLARVASIQNAYNLLNRTFEDGLAEIALREEVGLLAYSPLGGGTLTGKYLDGRRPPGSRRAIDQRGSRYDRPNADAATQAYVELAGRHGLDPARMAIAFVLSRSFTTAAIIGATSLEQLATDAGAAEVELSAELLEEIDDIRALYTDPCP